MFGRMYDERGGRIGALLIFVGMNMTFFTQFVMGAKGMPRRYYNYLPEFTEYHVLSTIGSYVLAIGFFVVAGNLIMSFFRGRPAPANPWGAPTLEWQCSSPPPHDNFAVTPEVSEVYDFTGLTYDEKTGGYVRKT